MKTLIIVDVQNDFCPGGSLAVSRGEEIIPIINKLSNSGSFDLIVASQDWHPAKHMSFASNYQTPVFEYNPTVDQVVWPDHCIQGTTGAEFHKDLDTKPIQYIIRKGMNQNIDSYSAFLENDKKTQTGLYRLVPEESEVFIVGIATDVCVLNTAIDAKNKYSKVKVITDACAEVNPNTINDTWELLQKKGIETISSKDLL